MSGSSLQSLAAASGLDIRAEDIERAILRRNPNAPRAKIAAIVDLIGCIAAATDGVARLNPAAKVEEQAGSGLGPRLAPSEGMKQLSTFATRLSLEDWAGPVAGPGEITERFAIPRSTLDDWRRSGVAIGLLKGARKHVFPLAQFVDGRPVEGLAEITAIVGDPRSTWLWLVEPRRRNRPTWLARLRRGEVAKVAAAAREDFA